MNRSALTLGLDHLDTLVNALPATTTKPVLAVVSKALKHASGVVNKTIPANRDAFDIAYNFSCAAERPARDVRAMPPATITILFAKIIVNEVVNFPSSNRSYHHDNTIVTTYAYDATKSLANVVSSSAASLPKPLPCAVCRG
ncbi:hypothetical protein AGMMS49950_07990 [Endomicrobiia bacterium]|nr:hypothetical protein AGMMS49950_07990 [Endomicrobiia bacterium]